MNVWDALRPYRADAMITSIESRDQLARKDAKGRDWPAGTVHVAHLQVQHGGTVEVSQRTPFEGFAAGQVVALEYRLVKDPGERRALRAEIVRMVQGDV